jgi:hypothetical protein
MTLQHVQLLLHQLQYHLTSKDHITVSQYLTTVNLTYSDVQTSNHESVSHQTSHSGPTSLSDITWCRKESSVDQEASISITETNKKSSATDCMNNLQYNLSNAKDCKQKGPCKETQSI